MEQRPLRLGDIVDDYCPRERRVTNHAVVAIVEDVIRQTRCTTCDAEHTYKASREPRLRKKPAAEGLYEQVLADVTGGTTHSAQPLGASDDPAAGDGRAASEANGDEPREDGAEPHTDGWLANRQLIRATLPRTENEQPVPRPIPEFTMHQRQPRGGRGFRAFGGGGGGNGNGNGNVNGNGPARGGFGPGPGRPGKHSGRRHRGGKRPPR